MFFSLPGPKKVFFGGFQLHLTVKNWEKLEKIEFSDSFNLTVFEVQSERSEGNHLIYSLFKTSLDHDLDAQRPQKPIFNWFWNQQKSRLSYFLRLFFISEPVHVKLDVAWYNFIQTIFLFNINRSSTFNNNNWVSEDQIFILNLILNNFWL